MSQATLFDDLPPAPSLAEQLNLALGRRITCRVHGLPAPAQDDALLLCEACRADLPAAREHCEQVLEACASRADAAGQAWLDAQNAADDATLQRLRKAEQAIAAGRDTDPRFVATWNNEKAQGTALGTLLTAYEAYTTEMRAVAQQTAQAHAGLAQIEQAENAQCSIPR